MLRWASTPLGQSDAHAVVSHWPELAAHLKRPGKTWSWTDSNLSASALNCLSRRGLIEKKGRDEWGTTQDLWDFVEFHGRRRVREESGTGQATLADIESAVGR